MDPETRSDYVEAGKVIQGARQKARKVAKSGTNLKVIADEIENYIRNEGLEPAFPVNLSINEEAAHYTPSIKEEYELKEDDVLKIDIGAHSNGYIADTALTVNPSGNHQEIIEAVEKVLESALEFIEPGVTVGEFGSYVSQQVPEEYRVISNLTGHYLGEYTQHAGISIPNVANTSGHEFEKGDAIAIEPFITDGAGKVKDGRKGNIYKLEKDKNVRSRVQRQILKQIKNYRGLPFTDRWLDATGRKRMALQQLVDQGIIHSYPVLKEFDDGIVAQAEHTVLVGVDDGENIITTRK